MLRIAGLWIGIVAIVVGMLIILLPDLIRWILGIALIVTGVMAVVSALKK
jgi:ABC-type multidrug transport system permease subunit